MKRIKEAQLKTAKEHKDSEKKRSLNLGQLCAVLQKVGCVSMCRLLAAKRIAEAVATREKEMEDMVAKREAERREKLQGAKVKGPKTWVDDDRVRVWVGSSKPERAAPKVRTAMDFMSENQVAAVSAPHYAILLCVAQKRQYHRFIAQVTEQAELLQLQERATHSHNYVRCSDGACTGSGVLSLGWRGHRGPGQLLGALCCPGCGGECRGENYQSDDST